MPFTVKQIRSTDVAEVVFRGPVTRADQWNAASEAVRLQRQFSIFKFLVIADEAESEASQERVRQVVDENYVQLEVRRMTRIAVVRPRSESARRFAELYEEACHARGWNARVFPNREVAMKWLEGAGRNRRI
jgi:hypothetical protein